MQAGDLVFCHNKGLIGAGIRWAQRRLHNIGTAHKWNHVGILNERLENGDWTVIQANSKGVSDNGLLSEIAPGGLYEVHSLPSEVDRTLFLAFCRLQVGAEYGYLSDISVALDLFLPESICLRRSGTWICSGLVAGGLWFCGYPKMADVTDLYTVTPAEIYSWVNTTF